MEVIFHPQARQELRASVGFYEKRVPGLGRRFLDAVDRAVDDLAAHPERCPVATRDIRRHFLRGFPFGIYYRHCASELRILAIYHCSRSPDILRKRFHKV